MSKADWISTPRRRLLGVAVFVCLLSGAGAAQAAGPSAGPPCPADDLDRIVERIEAQKTCDDAAAVYFSCQARYYNSPDMEEATLKICRDQISPKMTAKELDRYDMQSSEGCVTRFQGSSMRILWSAVRECRVKLAQATARRVARRKDLQQK